ncbi:hypothetical protein [Lentzea tibetensis]|uniref:hypothetical protein n=1 Tax=Lentzea tibetensis TaxID=2591470 RepID=UPI00164967B2|nr:hypothetical protein [Lentzea tibetensis]
MALRVSSSVWRWQVVESFAMVSRMVANRAGWWQTVTDEKDQALTALLLVKA